MKMRETWIFINNRYAVSDKGRVKSYYSKRVDSRGRLRMQKEIILKNGYRGGYQVVNISGFGKRKNWKVHQLVAIMFIPNPNNFPVINHINGIKTDNTVENLEWCTQKENCKHAFASGLRSPVINKGLKNGFSKIILDFNTGVFYYSVNELANLINIKASTLSARLRGQNKNNNSYRYV